MHYHFLGIDFICSRTGTEPDNIYLSVISLPEIIIIPVSRVNSDFFSYCTQTIVVKYVAVSST